VADKAMDVYLNDHLAGATFGADLAAQIQGRTEGTPLGDVMAWIAPQIEEDRRTLTDVLELVGASKNAVKQATMWVAEKASRVKFSGKSSGEAELGTFMALESLMLGVTGKLALWKALTQVADQYEALGNLNLDRLADRARAQLEALDRERLIASRGALAKQTAS
jgi:hypothetical protein